MDDWASAWRIQWFGKVLECLIEELLTYAEREFELDQTPKGSESRLREHLTAIWEQTGQQPEQLNNPEPNLAVRHLFADFLELSLARQIGMVLNPLTYSEIETYNRLYQKQYAMWEIQTLKQLDTIYLNVNSRKE